MRLEFALIGLLLFSATFSATPNIETPVGMLNQFKPATVGALGEYIVDNYNNTVYKLVTIASTFPGKVEPNWGRGTGKWKVDYLDTSTTFWSLMKTYTPIAVMTTSRNAANKDWVLEIGAKNLAQGDWLLLGWNVGRPPYIGGAANDPDSAAGLPNAGRMPQDNNPPDATRAADVNTGNTGRAVSANSSAIQQLIITKLTASFAPADLAPKLDTEFQGIALDNYVSGFAGYHAVWYDAWSDVCKAAWHTHVDSGITVTNASTVIELQLEVLIKWLNDN